MLKNTGGVFLGDIDNRVKILPINIRCAFLQDLGNNGIIKGGVVYLHHLIADKQSALMGAVLLGKHMWGRIMNIDVSTYKDESGKTLMCAAPSNLSPASEEYEALVRERAEKLREANPDTEKTAIPVDLVTCSGSGLDPHISPAAAEYQVARIAKANDMAEDEVREIVKKCTEVKFLGVFGEETVNVLKVNLMLDGIL